MRFDLDHSVKYIAPQHQCILVDTTHCIVNLPSLFPQKWTSQMVILPSKLKALALLLRRPHQKGHTCYSMHRLDHLLLSIDLMRGCSHWLVQKCISEIQTLQHLGII